MKIIFCLAGSEPEVREIEDNSKLRELIGGWLELVRPRYLPPELLMLVDEEGLLKKLPVNKLGCVLYGLGSPSPIVGPLVIAGEGIVDGEPDIVGLTDQQVEDLMERYLPKMMAIAKLDFV